MEKRRRITEEDIYLTEELIAQSCGRLKQSIVRVPGRALQSVGKTVRKHPIAAAGVAVGAGIALFALYRMMTSQGAGGRSVDRREQKSGPDMMTEIVSLLLPIVTPYIAGYFRNYMGTMFSGDQNDQQKRDDDFR